MKENTLVKNFGKLFNEREKAEEEIPENKRKGYLDIANVCMIIPKKRYVLNSLLKNFQVSETKPIQPEYAFLFSKKKDFKKIMLTERLTTGEMLQEGEMKSEYSREYLKVILGLMTHSKDREIIIKMKKDYPLCVESSEMIIVLAPVVKNPEV